MRKVFLMSALSLIVSVSTFAGGLLTNTNQHVSFLRMIARGASVDIDGVYYNPAGLGFLPTDGLYLSLNGQSAYQTRVIDATFPLFPEEGHTRNYKGTASAPFIPSVQAAYKNGNWVFSGSFAVGGGGGKASFDTGLPMFDSKVMAGMAQQLQPLVAATGANAATDLYTIASAMEGRQFIYAAQFGITYKVNDWLSVFGGGRMNYFSGGYTGYLTANIKEQYKNYVPNQTLYSLELDLDQTGWGLTPIIGADVKLGKWNMGLKYEFMTSLNIENQTKKNSDPDGALAAYKNGVNTPNDIPALLTAAVGYEILPTLRASVEYHFFDDKQAGMAGDKQEALTRGTNEYLMGIEWDVHDRVSISGGYQRTDYGLADDFQSDTSFSCDSYSLGFGAGIKLSSKLKLNVAYFWTNYSDYTKEMDNYNGLPLGGTDVYSRTNKVFGLGVDYKF
jgi:long-chain fatty acid transport protein